MLELNLGATAAGTGLNSDPRYQKAVVAKLSELTGLALKPAEHLVEMTESQYAMLEAHGALKLLAVELTRISNDLRLMSSGPQTGLAEINLPAVQPGSSIMPGKVNPVCLRCSIWPVSRLLGTTRLLQWLCRQGSLS